MFLRFSIFLGLLAFGAACSGEIGDSSSRGSGRGASAGAGGAMGSTANAGSVDRSKITGCGSNTISDPGLAISRRLTRTDYDNTVRDLLGDTSAPASTGPTAFPGEELTYNFDNNPQMLSVSAPLVRSYFDAAEALSAKAVQNLSSLVGGCATAGDSACAQQFIRSFGLKVFRR